MTTALAAHTIPDLLRSAQQSLRLAQARNSSPRQLARLATDAVRHARAVMCDERATEDEGDAAYDVLVAAQRLLA